MRTDMQIAVCLFVLIANTQCQLRFIAQFSFLHVDFTLRLKVTALPWILKRLCLHFAVGDRTVWALCSHRGRYKTLTGSTRTRPDCQINSDQLKFQQNKIERILLPIHGFHFTCSFSFWQRDAHTLALRVMPVTSDDVIHDDPGPET